MKAIKLLCLTAILWSAAFSTDTLLAHAALIETVPAADSTVQQIPRQLELAYSEDVRLVRLVLTKSDGSIVATAFTPQSQTQSRFSVALPELAQDTYSVEWTILSVDSHRMAGNFSFTVAASNSNHHNH